MEACVSAGALHPASKIPRSRVVMIQIFLVCIILFHLELRLREKTAKTRRTRRGFCRKKGKYLKMLFFFVLRVFAIISFLSFLNILLGVLRASPALAAGASVVVFPFFESF
jgi:hypothetical protein